MLGIGGGRDVAWCSVFAFQRLQSFFGSLALDDLPAGLVERDQILRNHQSIVLPTIFRLVSRSAFEASRRRIADGQSHSGSDFWQHVQICDIRIAAVGVVLVRVMDDAIHVFQGDGYAGTVMVFQHRDINQDVAALRQNLGQSAANAAIRDQRWFVINSIGAEALHTVSARRYLESRVLHFVAITIPDHDIVRFDSGLLQALANGFDE